MEVSKWFYPNLSRHLCFNLPHWLWDLHIQLLLWRYQKDRCQNLHSIGYKDVWSAEEFRSRLEQLLTCSYRGFCVRVDNLLKVYHTGRLRDPVSLGRTHQYRERWCHWNYRSAWQRPCWTAANARSGWILMRSMKFLWPIRVSIPALTLLLYLGNIQQPDEDRCFFRSRSNVDYSVLDSEWVVATRPAPKSQFTMLLLSMLAGILNPAYLQSILLGANTAQANILGSWWRTGLWSGSHRSSILVLEPALHTRQRSREGTLDQVSGFPKSEWHTTFCGRYVVAVLGLFQLHSGLELQAESWSIRQSMSYRAVASNLCICS